jgi:hypothetical protein
MFEFLKLEMLSGDIYKQVTAAAVFLPRRCLVVLAAHCHCAFSRPALAPLGGGGWRRGRRLLGEFGGAAQAVHRMVGVGKACALVHGHSCLCPSANAHRDEELHCSKGELFGCWDWPTLIGPCV